MIRAELQINLNQTIVFKIHVLFVQFVNCQKLVIKAQNFKFTLINKTS